MTITSTVVHTNSGTATSLTSQFGSYTATDLILCCIVSESPRTFTMSAGGTGTGLASIGNYVHLFKVTPSGPSQTTFTINRSGSTIPWRFCTIKLSGVDLAATVDVAGVGGTANTTAAFAISDVALSSTSVGNEMCITVNSTGGASTSWGSASNVIYSTDTGPTMLIQAINVGAGLSTVVVPDITRGSAGQNRVETSVAAVFRAYVAPTGGSPNIKLAGSFAEAPVKHKAGGTFSERPLMVKVGGTFVEAF